MIFRKAIILGSTQLPRRLVDFNDFLDPAVCFNNDDGAIGIDLLPPPVCVLVDFLPGRHVRDTAAVGLFHDAIAVRVDLGLSAIYIDLTRTKKKGKGRERQVNAGAGRRASV